MIKEKSLNLAAPVLLGLVVTACGPAKNPYDNKFNNYEVAALGIVSFDGHLAESITPRVGDLPEYGTATYSGYLGGTVFNITSSSDLFKLLGDLTLALDFADLSNLTGSATNFYTDDGAAYSGSLTLQTGAVGSSGEIYGVFVGDLNGSSMDLVLVGEISGGESGSAPELAAGSTTGTYGSNGFEGFFFAD